MCQHLDCSATAEYGFEQGFQPVMCTDHALRGMVEVDMPQHLGDSEGSGGSDEEWTCETAPLYSTFLP